MIALREIRSEMRENAVHLTNSHAATKPDAPVRIVRSNERGMDEDADTHIEPWMEIAFRGLTHASETGEPYALISCFMNGKPAALIAATHREGARTHVLPLFMAVQPGMQFTPHADEDSSEEEEGEDGGGPDRTATGNPPAPR